MAETQPLGHSTWLPTVGVAEVPRRGTAAPGEAAHQVVLGRKEVRPLHKDGGGVRPLHKDGGGVRPLHKGGGGVHLLHKEEGSLEPPQAAAVLLLALDEVRCRQQVVAAAQGVGQGVVAQGVGQ
jgi:hypothetical protein